MKKSSLFTMAAAAIFALASCNSAADKKVETTDAQEAATSDEAAQYAIASDAKVYWKGFKTNVDWSHWGTINVEDGAFEVKNGELVGGSFSIDMTSMVAEDFKESPKYNDLMGHLASPDFFDVENHPKSKFTITNVVASADETKGTTHKVSGNLDVRGISKNITFDATVVVEDGMVTLSAPEFGIDRKEWNVMYNSTGSPDVASFTKDKFIDDTILLWLEVSGASI